ncbi:MAG: putative NAD/FAD-binding protein [Oleispira sp.]|jgi:predicted NAD/FAD-binding protein
MKDGQPQVRQKIAVIGAGISGLLSAYLLSREHDVTLFEANKYLGGHTHTKTVQSGGKTYGVNTGFIVFNDWTYPNFIKLMDQIGVASEDSEMSFSVRDENTAVEYNGTSFNSLFAQRSNIFKPSFWFMIKDILRFNKQTVEMVQNDTIPEGQTLGEFVNLHGYGDRFVNHYIVPMGAAIWSASVDVMMEFPLRFFLKFFNNHGMLSVDNRPQWRVITGGSQSYIEPLIESFKDNIHLNSPISSVKRSADNVTVKTYSGAEFEFDQVVFACHSDQALGMLDEPSQAENDILGAIPYQRNEVVLHTDRRLMPKRKLAWAAWNYHIPQRHSEYAMVTYHMNALQNFEEAPDDFMVTLNRTAEIAPGKIIDKYDYAHPVFTMDGIAAQQRHSEINNKNRSHFCGAYWFNGFHEDGVNSALRVAKSFGIEL